MKHEDLPGNLLTQNILEIRAKGEKVTFTRTREVGEHDWQKLLDFWRPYAIESESSVSISVPLSEFYAKKYWFTVNWLASGNEVDTDESVSEAFERLRAQESIFRNLAHRGYIYPSTGLRKEIETLGLKRSLTEAQLTNIASTIESPAGANFSVPGAGKTATTLVLAKLLMQRGQIDRLLVVCPKSAFEAWMREPEEVFSEPLRSEVFESSVIDPNTKILMVNFERAESVAKRRLLKQWLSLGDGFLVVDEAHRIKRGSSGKRWLACMDLSSVAKRVDVLTGTPMPQSYADLRNLFSISWKSVPKSNFGDSELVSLKTGGLFVRTTKGQLNLPEPNFIPVPITMGKLQEELYSAITRSYQGLFSANQTDLVTLRKKGRAIMTVLAAATNPALIRKESKEELISELRWPPVEISSSPDLIATLNSYMSHEIPSKYQWVSKFVAKAAREGKKVLVWSTFVGNLELLRRTLNPFFPAMIHGSIGLMEREQELSRFRDDPLCSVLLTNPQTLGEGISLHQTAHDAVFVDRTYNAAQYLQALDRIHRLGLPPGAETNFYILQSEGSIDKRVEIRLSAKISALGEMLNDEGLRAMALVDEDGGSDLLSSLGLETEDVADLFRHLDGASA